MHIFIYVMRLNIAYYCPITLRIIVRYKFFNAVSLNQRDIPKKKYLKQRSLSSCARGAARNAIENNASHKNN